MPPGPGNDGSDGLEDTEPGEDIAMAGIEGLRAAGDEGSGERGLGENVRCLEDAAFRVDEARDAGICCTGDRNAVLHGAEHGHGEMLEGCRGSAEPGIVRDRRHDRGALVNESAHQIWKDDLEADDCADRYFLALHG